MQIIAIEELLHGNNVMLLKAMEGHHHDPVWDKANRKKALAEQSQRRQEWEAHKEKIRQVLIKRKRPKVDKDVHTKQQFLQHGDHVRIHAPGQPSHGDVVKVHVKEGRVTGMITPKQQFSKEEREKLPYLKMKPVDPRDVFYSKPRSMDKDEPADELTEVAAYDAMIADKDYNNPFWHLGKTAEYLKNANDKSKEPGARKFHMSMAAYHSMRTKQILGTGKQLAKADLELPLVFKSKTRQHGIKHKEHDKRTKFSSAAAVTRQYKGKKRGFGSRHRGKHEQLLYVNRDYAYTAPLTEKEADAKVYAHHWKQFNVHKKQFEEAASKNDQPKMALHFKHIKFHGSKIGAQADIDAMQMEMFPETQRVVRQAKEKQQEQKKFKQRESSKLSSRKRRGSVLIKVKK